MDIETVAHDTPEKIQTITIDPATGVMPHHGRAVAAALGLTGDLAKQAENVTARLYDAFIGTDASQIEINPLAVTDDGKLMVLDAKVGFDPNALYRHPDLVALRDLTEEDPAEVEASKYDLAFIKLDGTIGCLVNGAGLAMATMDIIKLNGAEPANFLDVGGGADKEKVTNAFKLILKDPAVKGILVNIFGGIMRCDIIAEGIIAAAKEVTAPMHPPTICATTYDPASPVVMLPSSRSTRVTAGLKWAPDTVANMMISPISAPAVAAAFSKSCSPTSPGERFSAMIPEPTTAMIKNALPIASAARRADIGGRWLGSEGGVGDGHGAGTVVGVRAEGTPTHRPSSIWTTDIDHHRVRPARRRRRLLLRRCPPAGRVRSGRARRPPRRGRRSGSPAGAVDHRRTRRRAKCAPVTSSSRSASRNRRCRTISRCSPRPASSKATSVAGGSGTDSAPMRSLASPAHSRGPALEPAAEPRSDAMCGRFVASTSRPTRSPPTSAPRSPSTRSARTSTSPRRTTSTAWSLHAAATASTPRVEAFHWGLIPSWAKDRKIAVADDQRPGRDARREAGVQGPVHEEALHHPDGRLLRVEGRAPPTGR